MSLLFLRFIRLFGTYAYGKCSFKNCTLDFLYFQVFITILSIRWFLPNLFIAFFFTSKPEQFYGFLHVFILFWIFQKY